MLDFPQGTLFNGASNAAHLGDLFVAFDFQFCTLDRGRILFNSSLLRSRLFDATRLASTATPSFDKKPISAAIEL